MTLSTETATNDIQPLVLTPPDEGKILRRTRLEVPVKLTEDEIRIYGEHLAKVDSNIVSLKEKKKNVNAEFNNQINAEATESSRLSRAITSKSELRNMDVYDVLIGSQVFTRRADNHETVAQKPASFADTQEDLFTGADDEDYVAPSPEIDEPVGEMATSSVGDAVFIGGDGEEVDAEEKPKKAKGRGKGKVKK